MDIHLNRVQQINWHYLHGGYCAFINSVSILAYGSIVKSGAVRLLNGICARIELRAENIVYFEKLCCVSLTK